MALCSLDGRHADRRHPLMLCSWSEIKSRALALTGHKADAMDEYAQAKPTLINVFELFGITVASPAPSTR